MTISIPRLAIGSLILAIEHYAMRLAELPARWTTAIDTLVFILVFTCIFAIQHEPLHR
jgi:hypothetical protein